MGVDEYGKTVVAVDPRYFRPAEVDITGKCVMHENVSDGSPPRLFRGNSRDG